MSYATVKLTDGSEVYVSNSVKGADFLTYDVSNDVIEVDTDLQTLFAANIPSGSNDIQEFNLKDGGIFSAVKRPGDVVDFQIRCEDIFNLWRPADQIESVTWAVEYGSVTLSNERISGTTKALVRVTGGGRLYSWHNIRATINCVSGQIYTPIIELQLVR